MHRILLFFYFSSFGIFAAAQIPSTGLVAHYSFNGNANETLGATPGINGVLYNVTAAPGLNGTANTALHFDGTADTRVDVTDNAIFNFGSGDYTTSIWARYTSPQQNNLGYSMLYCKGGFQSVSPGLCGFVDFLQTAPNAGAAAGGAVTTRSSYDQYAATGLNNYINNNEWHHFVFMRRGRFLKIFIDGILKVSRENNLDNLQNTYPLRFGANQDFTNSQNFTGDMDEVRFYNRALCDDEVSQLYNAEKPPVDLISDMVAYYPFNGNTNDESGNNNHGTVNGATLTNDRFGVSNKAYSFDGLSNTIDISTQSNVTGSTPRTISSWIKLPENITADNTIYKGGDNNDGADFTFIVRYVSPGRIVLYLRRFNNDVWSSEFDYSPGEWLFAAVTFDGTNTNGIRFYLNGVQLQTQNGGTSLFNSTPVNPVIGNHMSQQGYSSYFKGAADDIRVYSRKLTVSEIESLYLMEAPATNTSAGLVAYYPFNGNANDESGNGHNGTLINAVLTNDRFGAPDKAMLFNGSNAYINLGNNFDFNGNFSISFFAQTLSNTGNNPSLLTQGIQNFNQGLHLMLGNSYFRFDFWGNNPLDCSTNFPPVGQWAYWAFTYDSATNKRKIYLNGDLLCSDTPPSDCLSTGDVLLGRVTFDNPLNVHYNGVMDEVRIYNRVLTNTEVKTLGGVYNNYTCVQWNTTPPVLDPETRAAFDYLCAKNIILHSQVSGAENITIRKDELAKILFRGLYEPDINTVTPVDDAPNPFVDLQPSVSAYSKEAKALSYLEYDDGISVFKRELTHFRPQFPIQRRYVIKAMLEAFNIKPYTAANAPVPTCWYTDVPVTEEMYYYILKAREMGFIRQQTLFNPGNPITRKEAFLVLYRILKYFETTAKPAPATADYFIPCNINPCNFGRNLGVSDANFNAYTKTSFAIAGLMPLSFAHSYNSAYTELPDSSYNIIEPLGKGWTHNYNCYLQRVADDLDSNIRYVITWGDGTMNSFLNNNGIYQPECSGIYATLVYDNTAHTYTYKTKSQVSYIFSRYILSTRTIWVLTSVKDRNNNSLTLTWTPFPVVAVPSQIRLFKVQDDGGRYLQLGYEMADPSKIKTVTAVTGSISRSISFAYENNYSDLKAYINLNGDSTVYYYEDSLDITKNHLLKQIKLPKGNIVDNTYEQRKLKSTQMAGQYQTNVNTQFNYAAANNTNFTESNISTTRNGVALNSSIKQDQLGNVKNAVSPTGNLSLSYNDPLHQTKPTFFSNSINNLSANTIYDTLGNVTSVTKISGSINLKDSFTYNGFNDILTYTNARGNTTTFTYNSNGNLVKIKDALNNETDMLVNGNGTVSKITNPESIYTDFTYDAFGNTTQSKLMNTITAAALYDDASRLVSKTDPNGTVTNIEYEINDLVKKIIADPGGLNNTVAYNYDKNDNLNAITNPMGGKTTLIYNNFDQLTEYRFGGFNKIYTYNEDGTVASFKNQNNHTFSYVYNGDGTLQSDGYANYLYDAEFNLQSITSTVNGKAISFGYDALKRTTSIGYTNDFAGNIVLYDYDNNNNVTAITYPGGFKVGYEYDILDRLIRVYNFATNNNFASYSYYNDGRLKDQVNGNGTKTFYRYDSYGRLDSIGNYTSANANIASYKFVMDNVGNHLSETNHEPALPIMAALQTEGFTYVHDSLNRMNSRGATDFTYDNNGNNSNATGQWNADYTFDVKDNLLTSNKPVLTCEYDALENRRRKNDTIYVLDILGGSNVLMETDAGGNAYAYYIHGLGLICRLDAAQTNPAYYHYDYRGSTTAITNSSETVTHGYRYGAFGEMLLATEAGFKNPYRYVGKYGVQYEGDSMYFMRARYYNAVKGRFLGEDPESKVNLYNYAGNNPIKTIDFDGRNDKVIELLNNSMEAFSKLQQGVSHPQYNQTIISSKMALSNLYHSIESSQADKEFATKLNEVFKNTNTNEVVVNLKLLKHTYMQGGSKAVVDFINSVGDKLSAVATAFVGAAKTAGAYLATVPTSTIAAGVGLAIAVPTVTYEIYLLPQPEKALDVLQEVFGKSKGKKAWSFIYGIDL